MNASAIRRYRALHAFAALVLALMASSAGASWRCLDGRACTAACPVAHAGGRLALAPAAAPAVAHACCRSAGTAPTGVAAAGCVLQADGSPDVVSTSVRAHPPAAEVAVSPAPAPALDAAARPARIAEAASPPPRGAPTAHRSPRAPPALR